MNIRGAEYPIKRIFHDDFFFTIPLYQRPYAWTTEEAEELLQDLLTAMGDGEKTDDLPPYFLGSIVIIKDDEQPDAQVVDGQQRLTTLTMLLAALRNLIKSKFAADLTSFLCEKGNVIKGTPDRYRLRLRDRDSQFFERYIQEEGGIEDLKSLQEVLLPDSQRNIRDNTLGFIRELQALSAKQLVALAQFIINRCFLIVVSVSTPDLDSVYRIFSVLNNRGLNLSYPDILKAEIINSIPPSQQESYTKKWEDIEAILGRDLFEDLFFSLRSIFARERMRKGMIEEFHEYVHPGHPPISSPQDFIDNTLHRYANALNNIVNTNYHHGHMAKEINGMFKWLNQLDHGRWRPPALYYFVQNWNQPSSVLKFLTDIERLAISFMLCKIPPSKRIDRYCDLLQAIHDGRELDAPDSPLQLTSREHQEVLRILNGNIYLLHYPCRYILLRLDAKLSEGTASYDHRAITTEHVLPQNPSRNSEWIKSFPTTELREKYVHRLGNLVLLSRGKNIVAENYDFNLKKEKYFRTTDGISSFALTTQVLSFHEWTPAIIEQRQSQLMSVLRDLWRL